MVTVKYILFKSTSWVSDTENFYFANYVASLQLTP